MTRLCATAYLQAVPDGTRACAAYHCWFVQQCWCEGGSTARQASSGTQRDGSELRRHPPPAEHFTVDAQQRVDVVLQRIAQCQASCRDPHPRPLPPGHQQLQPPDQFADVLVTSHALGWQLEDELAEFERVVKAGGWVIHCPGTAEIPGEEEQHLRLISADWGYEFARYQEADGWKRKYWKRL